MASEVEDPEKLAVELAELRGEILAAESVDRPDKEALHALRGRGQLLALRLYCARRGLPPDDDGA